MAEAFGFRFFEATVFPDETMTGITPIKKIIQNLLKDVVSAQNQRDNEKDSFRLKNGSANGNGADNSKGCGC